MSRPKFKDDRIFAQHICDRLRSGDSESILQLYSTYHSLFSVFARKRIFADDLSQVETILNDFWLELLNTKAICSFQGKTSLRSYLLTILNRRIIDANRKIIREKNKKHEIKGWTAAAFPINIDAVSPEEEFIHKERMNLIYDALVRLAKISTRDAYLMKMYLEGLGYTEMAERELDPRTTGSRDLKKKISAIKKQFTRNKTGTLARFKDAMAECLKDHKLDLKDLLSCN